MRSRDQKPTAYVSSLAFLILAVTATQNQFECHSESVHHSDFWSFDSLPSPNSTHHLVFDTVSSLLQTWGNTRLHNGHTIVPGVISKGTLFYHGTHAGPTPPTTPDWVATDPEHSYIFCTSLRSAPAPCWHLTLVTTRDFKVIYFDGSSAGKIPGGSMDSQDMVLWGKVVPERILDERGRIEEMCKQWGRKGVVDGFVRMELDFEVMLCDFEEGLKVVSALNLAFTDFPDLSRTPKPPTAPDIRPARRLGDDHQNFKVWLPGAQGIEAGLRHSHFPGETRVKLDYTRLISFYDTGLFPSLVEARMGQKRWEHRLEGMARDDVRRLGKRLVEILEQREDGSKGSGVDWKALYHVVQQRYADQLGSLRYLLTALASMESIGWEDVRKVHAYLTGIIQPYVPNGTHPTTFGSGTKSHLPPKSPHGWAVPIFMECATTHTRFMKRSPSSAFSLTASEELLFDALSAVEKEICRVVVGMWARGVEYRLDPNAGTTIQINSNMKRAAEGTIDEKDYMRTLVSQWTREIDGLMKWLDWNVWVKCEPRCSFEESCYLPTWPFYPTPADDEDGTRGARSLHQADERQVAYYIPNQDNWRRNPQPRCFKRIHPSL